MARSRISSKGNGGGNGGILGSGIFGTIGTGVVCDAENKGMYCSLVKFVNVILMIGMLIGIVYLVYIFFSGSGKQLFSGGGRIIRKSLHG